MTRDSWGGTANGNFHFGKDYTVAQLAAAGFTKKKKSAQAQITGGVVAAREVRLQAGIKLYRFCGSRVKKRELQFKGDWWFDEDMCILLWKLSDRTDASFRRTARAMFAVLEEWSDMNFCVSGHLKRDYWAIRGTTALAEGKHERIQNQFGHEARQLYVPGGLSIEAFEDPRQVMLTRAIY